MLFEASQNELFRLVLLVQPSSAAVKRVFLILQCFTAQQPSSLEDLWKALLCCNTTCSLDSLIFVQKESNMSERKNI